MKLYKYILIALVLALAASSAVLIWVVRKNSQLSQDLIQQKDLLEKGIKAKAKLNELKEEAEKVKQENIDMLKKMPLGDPKAFSLIKELTIMADKLSIKDIKVEYGEKNTEGDARASESTKNKDSKKNEGDIGTIFLNLSFVSGYQNLINFLNQIKSLERTVIIDSLSIIRSEDVLPWQRVDLKITTYFFNNL